jgi:hypothetical protein
MPPKNTGFIISLKGDGPTMTLNSGFPSGDRALSRNNSIEPQMDTKKHEWKAARKYAFHNVTERYPRGYRRMVSLPPEDRALSSQLNRSAQLQTLGANCPSCGGFVLNTENAEITEPGTLICPILRDLCALRVQTRFPSNRVLNLPRKNGRGQTGCLVR